MATVRSAVAGVRNSCLSLIKLQIAINFVCVFRFEKIKLKKLLSYEWSFKLPELQLNSNLIRKFLDIFLHSVAI